MRDRKEIEKLVFEVNNGDARQAFRLEMEILLDIRDLLANPAIQVDGVPMQAEIGKKLTEVFKPHLCSNPELSSDCSGCTDDHTEGTHQGCTKQHGHVGCDQMP